MSVCRLGRLAAGAAAFAGIGTIWGAAAWATVGSTVGAADSAAAASTEAAVLPAGKTLPLGAENGIDSDTWLPCTMLATDALTGTPLLAILSPAQTRN